MSIDKQKILDYLRGEIASLKVSDWEAYAGISKDAIYAEALSEVMEKINSGSLDAEPAGKPCGVCWGVGYTLGRSCETCNVEFCCQKNEPKETCQQKIWCPACHGSGKVG